jgi:hypothetical protein
LTTLLDDAFDHHIWATQRLIDACAELTHDQLRGIAPPEIDLWAYGEATGRNMVIQG